MNYILTRYYTIQAALLSSLLPYLVNAQSAQEGGGKLINPLSGDMSFMEFITFLVKDVLVGLIAPIVLTLALLYTGFMFIMAQGKEQELARAKNMFFFVIIGGILLLGAYVILEVLVNTVDELTTI